MLELGKTSIASSNQPLTHGTHDSNSAQKNLVEVSPNKSGIGKAKRTWNKPSPNYYQAIVVRV
jgi:hypothetical protein